MRKELIWILMAGLIVGIADLVLVFLGNPSNMGFCIACFERDIAGAIGLHHPWKQAWIRPEIIGILLGAFIAALFSKEFRARGGASPVSHFLLGMFVVIGAMAFLGCPLRMIIRLGGGDLNAVVALVGFIVGIAVGVVWLKQGFMMGRTQKQGQSESYVLPAMLIGLLVLVIFLPVFKEGGPIFVGAQGHPGCEGTPISQGIGILFTLGIGLVVGIIAQRSRLCLAGGIRDLMLIRSGLLVSGFITILAVVLIGNLILGKFNPGFENQPIAHTAHLWNFMGMALVGLGSTLLGGCPLRQLVLAGNGNTDSGLSVLGMVSGAAIAHNFGLVKAASIYGKGAVILGLVLVMVIGFVNREK